MPREHADGLEGMRSALIFLGLVTAFELGVAFVLPDRATEGIRVGTASVSRALIAATGIPASQFGPRVYLPSRMLSINTECTGLYLIAAFAALVVSSRASVRNRVVGVVFGSLALLAGNLVRLVAVAHMSEKLAWAFDFSHDLLFQIVMVVLVIATWAAWSVWANRVRN